MSSFSALLSSLDGPTTGKDAPKPKPAQTGAKAANPSDRFKLTSNNAAAGVKRKLNETAPGEQRPTNANTSASRPATGASRFQLTAKPKAPASSSSGRPTSFTTQPSKVQRTNSSQASRPTSSGATSNTTTNAPPTQKKGFAAILEQAKQRQAEAEAANAGGIKHKPIEKMSRKERLRMMAEHKAAGKKGGKVTAAKPGSAVGMKNGASSSKGVPSAVAKKVAAPLAYKGTMRAAGTATAKPKPKERRRQPNEYADWSDLDEMDGYGDEEEEEEERGGYDSYESDDMEGGFDDVMEEEEVALKNAKKEDLEALKEEERLKQEKLARKKKLEQLSKSAAAAKKRY